jgi:hypothetical protein
MFLHKLSKNLPAISMLVALCLGITAQYLFTGEIFTHQLDSNTWVWTPSYSLALVMLLLAIGFATLAAYSRENIEAETSDAIYLNKDEPNRNRIWLISSGACYMLSILLYLFVRENNLVRWLWTAGIGLLIIPLWLKSKCGTTIGDKIPSWEWILAGIISLIGFELRYWKLTEIPSHVDNDVALMGTFGLKLIDAGQHDWIGFSLSEHLLSYDQFMAWSMRLFGQNHYGLVMHSVVLGTLSLLLIFLLGRELGGRFVGFAAIGLLTISYTHIQFSRILFGNSSSLIAIFSIYAFFKGVRTRKSLWFAIAGVLIGWGLLLYDSARVIPLIMLSIMIWQWLWQRESFKSMVKNWGMLLAGIILGFGPMLAFAIRNFFSFSGRANVVTLWNPIIWQHELSSYDTTSPVQVLWQQIWRTFLTLHLTGDQSPHFMFPRPMVEPLTALLFILGAGYGLSKIKNIKYFSLLSWIFFAFIFGGVLTADPPYWPHLNIALPAIALVAAIGGKSLADKITVIFGQTGYKVYAWVMVSVIIITGITNWKIYYDYVKNNAGPRIRIVRYLESLPPGYSVYIISPDWSWNEYAFRFFNRGMNGQDLTSEMLVSDPPIVQEPAVFILFKNPNLVTNLREIYPDGEMEIHYNFNNLISFISYRVVPPEYELKPGVPPGNPLSLPGWLLIFGFVMVYVGYVAYSHYSSETTDPTHDME